jgi:sugar (pentulose or hexulose) kinase
MPTLLGLDLGTSSFKVSAYRDTGDHLGTVSRETPWRAAASGSELAPHEFADVVRNLVEACAASRAADPVAAIGVTGMAEAMFVETAGGVVSPARAWNEAGHPVPVLPDAELFARTGLLDVARTPAVELRRITDAGRQVRSWSGLPEYAVQVLGGSAVAERSLAARSGLVDVRTGDWSAPLRDWAGVQDVVVPPLWPAGTPAGAVAVAGWCKGAVLTVAGHDHVVAALGAGAADDGSVFDSLGTGEALIARIASDTAALGADELARLTAAGFNVGLGLDEHDVIAFAGLGTGNRFNLLLTALADNGFDRGEVLRAEERPAGEPGAVGAALTGEAAELIETLGGPDWQVLRGRAAAIVSRTVPDLATARILWWAAVARATRNARDALDALRQLAPRATRRVAAGGWLGNSGIREVRERMLGSFEVPTVGQSGTRGAALLAGLAAGVYSSRSEFPPLTGKGATA